MELIKSETCLMFNKIFWEIIQKKVEESDRPRGIISKQRWITHGHDLFRYQEGLLGSPNWRKEEKTNTNSQPLFFTLIYPQMTATIISDMQSDIIMGNECEHKRTNPRTCTHARTHVQRNIVACEKKGLNLGRIISRID